MKIYIVTQTNSDGQTEILSVWKTEVKALRAAKRACPKWNVLVDNESEPRMAEYDNEESYLIDWLDKINNELGYDSPESINVEVFNLRG